MTPLENSWNDLLLLFGKVTTIAMLIPVVVALSRKALHNRPLRVIFWYCLLSFLINAFEHTLIWAVNTYTSFFRPALDYWEIEYFFFLTILYYLKDFLLLGLFYSLIFPIQPFNRFILWSGRILALAATINYLFIDGYNVFGVFNPLTDAVFIVALPLLYLWFSQQQSLRIPLKKSPYFWISLGLLLPNLLSLFLYFTGDYIHRTAFILYAKFSTIKNAFEIAGQILIAIGFLHARYARFIGLPDDHPTNIGS